MNISTSNLLERLRSSDDIESYFNDNKESMITDTVGEFIIRAMKERGLNAAKLAEKSFMSNFLYRIINGQAQASRDALIAIAFALELTYDETQRFLRIGSQSRLDPRIHRDAAIIFAIDKGMDLPKCNDLLYELGEKTV